MSIKLTVERYKNKASICNSKSKIIHAVLDPLKIYDFMDKLIDFMENNEASYLIKSAIIHFYFIYSSF
ncbi:Fic family protein [Clostridioides difficile]|uniref:Fic family protein n=1 Tax=Clostridioides difficile TaxID=1496 RepID=UPI001FF070F1|nr:Fic family protein [Clostridioides difficile]MCR1465646.1 Fic family protein [Clostridioides difficile]MCV2272593.1 Fic family protein [Clostridioides difficile]MDF3817510.1 Fic family protein [Clostridioides difficile]MDL5067519.1 Fic family protein [Clostridioides difficile]